MEHYILVLTKILGFTADSPEAAEAYQEVVLDEVGSDTSVSLHLADFDTDVDVPGTVH